MDPLNNSQLQVDALEFIRYFRVPDLQALLEFAQLPRQGYKRDLYMRCKLLLTSKWSVQLANKVQQIHLARLNSKQTLVLARHYANPTPFTLTSNPVDPLLPPAKNVQYVRLPFYDVIRTINCANISVYRRTFSPLDFVLNDSDVDLILNGVAKIFLRLAPTILTERQNDVLPPFLLVQCNNQIIINNNVLKPPGSLAHSIAFPTDLTEQIFQNTYTLNSLNYFWIQSPLQISLRNLPESYTIAIQLVRCVPVEILRTEIVQRPTPKNNISTVSTTNIDQDDIGLLTTRQSVSLICPISQSLIRTPAKSSLCSHSACFDLRAFLQMNQRRIQWTCPLCKKSASFQNLYVDQMMRLILENLPANCSTVEIESIPTGDVNKYDYVVDIANSKLSDSFERSNSKNKSENDEIIFLSDDDDNQENLLKKSSTNSSINQSVHQKIAEHCSNSPSNRDELLKSTLKRRRSSTSNSQQPQKRTKSSALKENNSTDIELIILSSSDNSDHD